jgi:hypothetical protein
VTRRYYTTLLGVSLLLLPSGFTALAQPPTGVQFQMIPERTHIANAGSVGLVVVVENNYSQDIHVVDFSLLNANLSPSSPNPLPTDISSHTSATGSYAVQIEDQGTNLIVGSLAYTSTGQIEHAFAQTQVEFQPTPSISRDLWLVLIGAVSALLGGVVAEAIKIWFEHRRQVRQQTEKALGVLIPGIDVCIRSVEQNRDPPLDTWHEVYFKEGLHTALAEHAKSRGQPAVTQDIAQLYARLVEYRADKQLVNRTDLIADLRATRQKLENLI